MPTSPSHVRDVLSGDSNVTACERVSFPAVSSAVWGPHAQGRDGVIQCLCMGIGASGLVIGLAVLGATVFRLNAKARCSQPCAAAYGSGDHERTVSPSRAKKGIRDPVLYFAHFIADIATQSTQQPLNNTQPVRSLRNVRSSCTLDR